MEMMDAVDGEVKAKLVIKEGFPRSARRWVAVADDDCLRLDELAPFDPVDWDGVWR